MKRKLVKSPHKVSFRKNVNRIIFPYVFLLYATDIGLLIFDII